MVQNSKGGISILLILVAVAAAYLLVQLSRVTPPKEDATPVTLYPLPSTQPLQNLHLTNLVPNSPAPSSALQPECNFENGLPAVNSGEPFDTDCHCPEQLIRCESHRCIEVISQPPGASWNCQVIDDLMDWCEVPAWSGDGNGVYCIGKPVIYLYPTQVTEVDVLIKPEETIFVSDPLYPKGGWKNVIARPGGKLQYQGHTYRELFYETAQTDINPPTSGIIIKSDDLESELTEAITKLGLTLPEERQEFLEWWLPRLRALNSPYILFSVLTNEEKKRVDEVQVSPKPDTFIEFIAYFKALPGPISVEPLNLPSKPPARVGFTAVEWGGVIDNSF